MFYVTTVNGGYTFWLTSTTWAFRAERGEKFETEEAAWTGLLRAKPFTVRRIYNRAKVVPV